MDVNGVAAVVTGAASGLGEATARELARRGWLPELALVSPAVTKGMASRGGVGVGGTPEEFAEHVRRETERLGKLIKAVGIKPQ